MISAGKYLVLGDFWTHFLPKYSFAVSMTMGMKLDQMRVDYLVLCSNIQDRKVSAKSVSMCGKHIIELRHEKTNDVVSKQVRHKPSCTSTGNG